MKMYSDWIEKNKIHLYVAFKKHPLNMLTNMLGVSG